MIKIGTTDIKGVLLGDTEISKVYLGTDVVYQNLPYDAEIEYLESTGTQWIDTGIRNNTNVKMKFKIKPSSKSGTYFMGVDSGIVFGTNNGVNFRANAVSSINAFDTNAFYSVEMYYSEGRRVCVIDDSETLSSVITRMLDVNILLLATSGGSGVPNYYLPWSISECKIWENDALVHDFIPVRVGTTGYLYDKVSKQLFGNAGTGDFILGPDITE